MFACLGFRNYLAFGLVSARLALCQLVSLKEKQEGEIGISTANNPVVVTSNPKIRLVPTCTMEVDGAFSTELTEVGQAASSLASSELSSFKISSLALPGYPASLTTSWNSSVTLLSAVSAVTFSLQHVHTRHTQNRFEEAIAIIAPDWRRKKDLTCNACTVQTWAFGLAIQPLHIPWESL